MRRGLVLLLTVTLGVAGCTGDGDPGTEARPGTTVGVPPILGALTDQQGVVAFVRAWAEGDAAAMRAVAADDAVVETALHFEDPKGPAPTGCSTNQNGQYQCIVDVAGGTRMYLLVGEPGAAEGRVWWVAEYKPGT